MRRSILVMGSTLLMLGTLGAQGLEGLDLRRALKDSASDFWIYDNIKAGQIEAQRTRKPLLISFRCVP